MKIKDIARACIPRTLRNWLRMPSKSLEYLWDRLAYGTGRSPTVRIRDDWQFRCHPAAQDVFEIFRLDTDQARELETFIEHCPPGIRLLDVGAHFGFFALAALHYGGPQAQVLCVEASPAAVKILKANLLLNAAPNRIAVLNMAMGGEDGLLPMLATGPLGADYFVIPSHERSDTILVPQRSLQSVLQSGFEPTHIKLDIEGAEYEVIEAALSTLASTRPVLFLELHATALIERGKDPLALLLMLKNAGYKNFVTEEGQAALDLTEWSKSSYRILCQ